MKFASFCNSYLYETFSVDLWSSFNGIWLPCSTASSSYRSFVSMELNMSVRLCFPVRRWLEQTNENSTRLEWMATRMAAIFKVNYMKCGDESVSECKARTNFECRIFVVSVANCIRGKQNLTSTSWLSKHWIYVESNEEDKFCNIGSDANKAEHSNEVLFSLCLSLEQFNYIQVGMERHFFNQHSVEYSKRTNLPT